MSLNLPVMKISAATVALRIRENQLDVLQKKLDDIVLNRAYPLDIAELLRCIQASLTKRLGFIESGAQEHKNIQLEVDLLEAIINAPELHHEVDGQAQRAKRLNQLRQSLLITSTIR